MADARVEGGPVVDPATGEPEPDQPDWSEFTLSIDARTLYLDNSEIRRNKAIQEAQFQIGVLDPWLMTRGLMLNPMELVQDLSHRADMQGLPGMLVPISPMAMQFAQMAKQNGIPEQQTGDLANTRDDVQSGIMNSGMTNDAISQGAEVASPGRMAMTPYGANNAETSF